MSLKWTFTVDDTCPWGRTPGPVLDRQERASAEEEDASEADLRLNLHFVPFRFYWRNMLISVNHSMPRNASGLEKWEKAEGSMVICRRRNLKA